MATTAENIRLGGLARRLVDEGLLSPEDARAAQRETQRSGVPLVTFLVTEQGLDPGRIAHAASLEFGIPYFDIASLYKDAIPTGLVDEKLIRQHHALPIFKRSNRLFVAISDPMNLVALD